MLWVILGCLRPEAEKIIDEEQAGFCPGRSTAEQIFNLRILCGGASNTNRTSIMFSLTSERDLAGCGMQHLGQR